MPFKKYIKARNPHPKYGGLRIIYSFPNDYRVYLLKNSTTEGLEMGFYKKGNQAGQLEKVESALSVEIAGETATAGIAPNFPGEQIFTYLKKEQVEPILAKIFEL